jgi:hypothetical protein
MYQSAQFKNPRNYLSTEDRETIMPMSPEEGGRSFLDMWKQGAMNTEALSQMFHAPRMKREEEMLALSDKYAAGADQRSYDAQDALKRTHNPNMGMLSGIFSRG